MKICDWCKVNPIPPTARADAETCSKACRQARHRARVNPAPAAAGDRPMRFRYMDPPYIGLAERYYSHDERCAEVDHERMIKEACDTNPDGWALSLSKKSLQQVLALCPDDVRVSIWVKGSRAGESYHERNAYEPVIFWRGRERKLSVAEDLDDVLIWGGRQHSHPGALVGMKNAPFAEWVFRQLGALAGDFLDDAFPGSGIIMRSWLAYGGRDPNEKPPQPWLMGLPDHMTAPPTRLASTSSRLEEANERAKAVLALAQADAIEPSQAAGTTRPIEVEIPTLRERIRIAVDRTTEIHSLGLDDPTDRAALADFIADALEAMP